MKWLLVVAWVVFVAVVEKDMPTTFVISAAGGFVLGMLFHDPDEMAK